MNPGTQCYCHTSWYQVLLPHIMVPSATATHRGTQCFCHTSWYPVLLPYIMVPSATATHRGTKCYCHTSWYPVLLPYIMVPSATATHRGTKCLLIMAWLMCASSWPDRVCIKAAGYLSSPEGRVWLLQGGLNSTPPYRLILTLTPDPDPTA